MLVDDFPIHAMTQASCDIREIGSSSRVKK